LVINNDGFIALDSDNTEDPTEAGQIAYVDGVGFRAYGESGAFTIGSGGGGGTAIGDLDGVYSNGQSITLDQGPVTLNDATTGALNSLALVKTGAGSGNVIDIGVNAALTGNAIDIDMNLGIAAKCIYIDNGGTARTGDDIGVNDDSTGAHSIINIDKSGSGASVGLDYQESYNGSSASFGAKFTLDNTDGIDTTAIQIVRGTGVRTVPAIDINDASTGSGDIIDIDLTGVYTGDVIAFASSAAATGNVFSAVMTNAVAMTAIKITGAGVRTQPFIELIGTQTGTADMIDLSADGAFTGDVIDFDISTAVGGRAINILTAGARTAAIECVTLAGTFSATLGGTYLDLNVSQTGAAASPLFDIDLTAIYTGNIIDFATSAASTGTIFEINMTNAVGAKGMNWTTAGARTADLITITDSSSGAVDLFQVTSTSTSSGHIFNIDVDSVFTGNVFDVTFATAAATGEAISIAMGTNVAGSALVITGSGARTDDLIKIDDASTGNSHIFDINLSAAYTGNVIDIATGNTTVAAIPIQITRGNGTNTGASIKIDDAGTTSAGVIDINVSGIATTNAVVDITYSAAATNDALAITTANAVAASAIVLTAAGARTDDLIKIDDSSTGDSHTFDINFSGIYTGNCLDITYASAAATGNAIDLNMGTNVAGNAIDIASAATGVDNKGSAINIAHTGDLVQGGTVVRIDSTSNLANADGNIVEIIQRAGAGQVGNYALYISAGGTNVEALKVDDGAVVFDETLTVTGAVTLSSTLSYRQLTEVVAAANTIAAAESGTVFFLNAANEFASELPAPAAGLHFTFIVTAAPSGASYTITTNGSANIIKGLQNSVAGDAGDSGTADDTITFVDGQAVAGDKVELYCDGTNWFAYAISKVAAGITFTTAS
jgi:hypothetical protein